MNICFSKCDQISKFGSLLVLTLVTTLLMPGFAHAAMCNPFLIYKNMDHPTPEKKQTAQPALSVGTLIIKISQLPSHSTFPDVYARFKPSFSSTKSEQQYLSCLFAYLQLDTDNDGVYDWKIASSQQLYSHLLPGDDDWDNDGISNLYDARPLIKNKKARVITTIPSHLQLSKNKRSQLSVLQKKILSKCNVLALNHTDTHSEVMLRHFLEVCQPALSAFKGKPINFILYAFSSHASTGNVIAAFYPEANYMSIAGSLLKESASADTQKLTIAHEIGHFLTFNILTPKELAEAASKYGDWHFHTSTPTSFFDPLFLKPVVPRKGFFPSRYSRTNIHEWFSEVFADVLYRKLKPDTAVATNIPPDFESWMTEKFQF